MRQKNETVFFDMRIFSRAMTQNPLTLREKIAEFLQRENFLTPPDTKKIPYFIFSHCVKMHLRKNYLLPENKIVIYYDIIRLPQISYYLLISVR